ncbi:hypothetical protein BCR32DRAFT_190670, partial [Anaeromyces robustus]
YKCCSNKNIYIIHWNETGLWGEENGNECLIEYDFCSKGTSFPSQPPSDKIYSKDETGLWGVENNNWC